MRTPANEPLRTREHSEIEYDCSFAGLSINYLVNSTTGKITFRTENISAEIIKRTDFKKFLENHEGIMSARPHYKYVGDPRVVALFQSSQKTLAEIMDYAKTLEDTSSFALETSRVRGKPDGDGTASTVLRYFTLGKVGDKLRLSQQESVLPNGDETLFPPELKELLHRIKDTAASLA